LDYFLSPKLTRESADFNLNNEVSYNPSIGITGLAGMEMPIGRTLPLFFYADLRVDAGMKYKWNKHLDNGTEAPIPFPEWEELSGDQIFIDFGLKYFVN